MDELMQKYKKECVDFLMTCSPEMADTTKAVKTMELLCEILRYEAVLIEKKKPEDPIADIIQKVDALYVLERDDTTQNTAHAQRAETLRIAVSKLQEYQSLIANDAIHSSKIGPPHGSEMPS